METDALPSTGRQRQQPKRKKRQTTVLTRKRRSGVIASSSDEDDDRRSPSQADAVVNSSDEKQVEYRQKKRMSSAVFQYIIEADSVRQVELQLEVCRHLQEDWSNRDAARREKLDDLGDALLHALNEILCGSSNYRQLIPATPALHVNRTIVLRLTPRRTYWVVLQCTWNQFTLEGMGDFELPFDGKQKYKSPETVQCIRERLVANLKEAMMAFTNSEVFSEVEHIKVMIKQIKGDMRQHFKNAAAGALVNSAVEAAKQVCDEAAGTGSRLCTRNAKGEEWTNIRTLETGNKYQVSRSSGKQTNAIVACIEWMKRNAPSFVENRPLYLGRSERIKFFNSLQEVASSPVDDICRLEMLRLSNHVAAIEMDGGAERPLGFGFGGFGGGRAAAVESPDAGSLALLKQVGKLLERIGAGEIGPGGGGSDIAPLTREGVPSLSPRTVGLHYFDWHHTEADTLDKVDLEDFRKNVAGLAVMSYVLADMPGRLVGSK